MEAEMTDVERIRVAVLCLSEEITNLRGEARKAFRASVIALIFTTTVLATALVAAAFK
jgi:hypothetical protein